MTLEQYIDSINKRYKLGFTTEHSFRGDLQQLLESLVPEIKATNEPKRQECGAPDYIITRKGIPLGYIEAKDIGADLGSRLYKEQFDRYKQSLQNLIITDYLNFQFFREGVPLTSVSIGQIQGNKITGRPEKYAEFTLLIKEFCAYTGQTIKSSAKLSKMMAAKARLLANVIEKALLPADNMKVLSEPENITLLDQFRSFKQVLLHDIKEKEFADIYAQTIAYGMFAARLHDPSLENFSRQEAAELIPKSNPFLRKLFQYIAGYDLDDRIKWIVDDLADIFRATNVADLLKDFGKSTQQNDPLIHFYETFLSEYDPSLRKSRGVWYTPEPVVNFIVRAVDDILKTEFGLPMGLADTSKTKITLNVQGQKVEKEVHKVQILDPATGTGTFLAEVVKLIYKQFEGQQGIWNNYVEDHLITRLNGFEILMASYTIAHMKLDLLLRETGYDPDPVRPHPNPPQGGGSQLPSFGGAGGGQAGSNQRFRVYLTNSLEEYHPDTGTLFANWLSAEANEANHIKRDTPVMVVIGNPPYSGESANKGEWIMKLMEDYKKEPGGKEKLKERNPKWINDDYVKFIRYGQYLVEKNGSGILAFINPHGFLDNPTFRGMRWNLLKTFDKIYTIDLHGNSKKKETCPDGSPDENVFDIMQGVSINLFIKKGNKKVSELGKVFHYDLFGSREMKYDFLYLNSLKSVFYKEHSIITPNYFFTNTEFDEQLNYLKGFSINGIFPCNSAGIVTARDEFTIHFSKDDVKRTIEEFLKIEDEKARVKFNLGKDVRDWTVTNARVDLINPGIDFSNIVKILYRPFEVRFTYYTGTTKGFHCMPRNEVMRHLFKKDNICLICPKQVPEKEHSGVFISRFIAGHKTCSAYNINNIFPLYLYPETNEQKTIEQSEERIPNLNPEIVRLFAEKLNLQFVPEKIDSSSDLLSFGVVGTGLTFAPIDILDYIYAVLHSPIFREKYKEFLKIDFPRVPYPKDRDTFWQLVKLGGELRQIHLLESPIVEKRITTYPVAGNNQVEKVWFEIADGAATGKIWINSSQYFAGVPKIAWEFFIGGYQPAQKWLKDRKGRALGFEDILHYQKIVVALMETERLMGEIDIIEVL